MNSGLRGRGLPRPSWYGNWFRLVFDNDVPRSSLIGHSEVLEESPTQEYSVGLPASKKVYRCKPSVEGDSKISNPDLSEMHGVLTGSRYSAEILFPNIWKIERTNQRSVNAT